MEVNNYGKNNYLYQDVNMEAADMPSEKILAKRTGYEFYDKERFIAIAKERGFEGKLKNI